MLHRFYCTCIMHKVFKKISVNHYLSVVLWHDANFHVHLAALCLYICFHELVHDQTNETIS